MRTAGKKILSLALAALLAVGTLPQAVFAVGETPPVGASGEIIAFEPLEDSVEHQTMPLGTLLEDLDLPETLTATVEVEDAAKQNDSVQDSGEPAQDDIADTNTNTQNGTPSDAQQPDDEDLPQVQFVTGSAAALGDSKADNTGSTHQTVSVPVLEWASEPEYDADTPDTYFFTPVLGGTYTLAEGVELPVVTVEVITPAAHMALRAAIQSGTPNFVWSGSTVSVVGDESDWVGKTVYFGKNALVASQMEITVLSCGR